MKYMMALAVCLLSALTLNAQTNVWKGRWAGGKDVLYTVDGQHVYKGRYASGKDILFTFTD